MAVSYTHLIYPLAKEGLIDMSTIIIDAKSGTSGAGRGADVYKRQAYAMHIMEGALPVGSCLAWGAISLPFLAAGFLAIQKILRENRRAITPVSYTHLVGQGSRRGKEKNCTFCSFSAFFFASSTALTHSSRSTWLTRSKPSSNTA